jgi:hypothetical protein
VKALGTRARMTSTKRAAHRHKGKGEQDRREHGSVRAVVERNEKMVLCGWVVVVARCVSV